MSNLSKAGLIFLGIIIILAVGSIYVISTQPSYKTVAPEYRPGEFIDYEAEEGFGFGVEEAAIPLTKSVETAPPPSAYEEETTVTSTDRLIIKTGDISIVVKDVEDAIKQISEYANQNDGFVVSSRIYKINNKPLGKITIRIPVELFDQGFENFKTLGDVESENTRGRDVTEEYTDLNSQLRNLKAVEERILSVLQKAAEITDILEVEKELKKIRNEIEIIEGRMKYLRESASLSTITVNLSTDPSVLPTLDETDKWRPIAIIKQAARSMVKVLRAIANLLLTLIIFIPVWLVIALIIFIVIKIYKRLKKKPKAKKK